MPPAPNFRRPALENLAQRLGLEFQAEDDYNLPRMLQDFRLFSPQGEQGEGTQYPA
ncbi:MAG: hypothetical protein HC821_01135 [Lewinella sp.]|nr:hypothetical protein [Lewinella sp.]